MSVLCDYEVHVKGSKKTCQMVYETMTSYGVKNIEKEGNEGDSYFIVFTGDCRGVVTEGMIDQMDPINVEKMKEDEIKSNGPYYWNYSLRAKSEALQCVILLRYWSKDLSADRFVYYENGKINKELEVPYVQGMKSSFDWDAMEYSDVPERPKAPETKEPDTADDIDGDYEEPAKEVEASQENEDKVEEASQEPEEDTAEETVEESAKEADDSQENEDKVEEASQEIEEDMAEETVEESAKEADVSQETEEDKSEEAVEETSDAPGDWYRWTFNENRAASGYGWKIALPDEFSANDGSIFEIVPKGYESEEDKTVIPVRIVAGGADSSNEMDENWKIHPNARAGACARIALRKTKREVLANDSVPELAVFGFKDSVAWMSLRTGEDGKVTIFCTIYHGDMDQSIRIQTVGILPNQKQELKKSVIEWIKTIEFDRENEDCPKEAIFEKEDCYKEILESGSLERFSFGIEEAQNEYDSSVDDMLEVMSYMDDNGLCKEEMPGELRNLLCQGMLVKEFFLKKADELIKKLKENGADKEIILQMLEKLHGLDEDCTNISLDEEEIRIDVPQSVKDIRIGWRRIETGMDGSKPIEPTRSYTPQPYEPEPYEAEYFGYTVSEEESDKEKEPANEEEAVEESAVEPIETSVEEKTYNEQVNIEQTDKSVNHYESEDGEDDMEMDWDTKYMKRQRKILERKIAMMEMDLADKKELSYEERQGLQSEIEKVTLQLKNLCNQIGD